MAENCLLSSGLCNCTRKTAAAAAASLASLLDPPGNTLLLATPLAAAVSFQPTPQGPVFPPRTLL